jgi:hypothetical protein
MYKTDTGDERDSHQGPLLSATFEHMLDIVQTHDGHAGSVDFRLGSGLDAKLKLPAD